MERRQNLRSIVYVLMLLTALSNANAGTKSKRSATEQTIQKNGNIRWEENSLGSEQVFYDGKLAKILKFNGLVVAASLSGFGQKSQAEIAIINNSKQKIDVVPETFSLEILKLKKSKALRPESPEKIANALTSKENWSSVFRTLRGFGESLATNGPSVDTSYGTVVVNDVNTGGLAIGTINTTTTSTSNTPDNFAQLKAYDANLRGGQALQMKIAAINSAALKANTLSPGQKIGGYVWFPREGIKSDAILRIPIKDAVYEFPFSKPQK